ncbi:ABC transporter substrate-binding protein [Streptomyces sp. L7]
MAGTRRSRWRPRQTSRPTTRASRSPSAKRQWSDGKPITSADVKFWFDLIKRQQVAVGGLQPGQGTGQLDVLQDRRRPPLHDHLRQASTTRSGMLANELSSINPLPSTCGTRPGTPRRTGRTSTARRRTSTGTPRTPLWKTVSGPFTVKSFSTAGRVVLAANPKYDGGEGRLSPP